MKSSKENVFKNSFFALCTVFRHAPVTASFYALFALTSSVFTVVQVLFLEKLVNHVTVFVKASARGSGDSRACVLWGALYVGSLFAAQLYQFSQAKLERRLNRRLTKSLSPSIADKFSRIAYQYYENAAFKDVMTRMSSNPQQTVHSAFLSVIACAGQLLNLAGILGVFFRASFWIGTGAALIGIPMSVLELRTAQRRQVLLGQATSDQRMGEYLQNLFIEKHSAYEIKIFRSKGHILDLWNETMRKIFDRCRRILKFILRTQAVVTLLKIAYTSFTAATLVLGFLSGAVELGVLVSILNSVERLFAILSNASLSFSTLGARTFEIGYYREFLDFEEQSPGSGELGPGLDIEFENVSFRYPGTQREILHGLSFQIKAGERVALVGVNGAGKSTVVKLLCGLYAPDSGRITVGGKDLGELSPEALHKAFSVVFQDFGSYQLTLRENIAFGDLTKLKSDRDLLSALSLAGGEQISRDGLDISLGRLTEDSVNLSRGQWQKIAVARAFLSDAGFIVLDEPTASLDPIAESRLYESFSSVLERRGSIVISHRLASARLAEKIIVLDNGEVAEIGSHEELLKNGGLYSVMYEEQSEWYKEA